MLVIVLTNWSVSKDKKLEHSRYFIVLLIFATHYVFKNRTSKLSVGITALGDTSLAGVGILEHVAL